MLLLIFPTCIDQRRQGQAQSRAAQFGLGDCAETATTTTDYTALSGSFAMERSLLGSLGSLGSFRQRNFFVTNMPRARSALAQTV